MTTAPKRKLIEVALPLEAINRASAREKSIRHGHPSTLHLWWARRPLAACRAVLFAQLVDDPSSHPDRFPTEADQAVERKRLFDIIERLVVWENSNDEALLREAHEEIAKCFDGQPPAIIDPFAGGGSIPLEAQRLGLEAHASDLNPVAVLINKALIEIPPRWAGQPPVFPGAADSRLGDWSRATGLAEDVRRYGQWMRDEAEKRIGHLYPKATLPDGSRATVIAWIWARTVTCPNPACGITMPLVRSFWLSKKKNRPTWLRPILIGRDVTYEVIVDKAGPQIEGTVGRQGATCVACSTPVPLTYVRTEGQAGRMGAKLMAVVAEGHGRRVYLPPTNEHIAAAHVARPGDGDEVPLSRHPQYMGTPRYGLTTISALFTNRQFLSLTTISDLIMEARDRVAVDARANYLPGPAADYGNAVATYLAFAVSRMSDYLASTTTWASNPQMEILRSTFARQAISMTWDFAEGNPFADSSGSLTIMLRAIGKSIDALPARLVGEAAQSEATTLTFEGRVLCTDPPYYDNVPYADLSDFFYYWLRRSLLDVYPELFSTLLTPKADELVADSQRFGGHLGARQHFEMGFARTFSNAAATVDADVPISLFYAFRQSELTGEGTASTGWETMLAGLSMAGLSVTATWPVRTERAGRSREIGSNALASSIVLACRRRPLTAETTTRRGLIQALKAGLPKALREMQQAAIAPVDLAQAALGPGMAVFTRYRTVVEADGSAMTVRTALALINQALDEVLSEQEGDFDADTRFCVKWFSQYGWEEAQSGTADTLSRATNTSVAGLERGGIFRARAGRARLIAPEELSVNWDPLADERVSVWEVVVRLAHALADQGGEDAARLMVLAGQRVDLDTAKELAYLLFSICEKRGWTQSALLFNGLGTSWSDLSKAAHGAAMAGASTQGALDFNDEE